MTDKYSYKMALRMPASSLGNAATLLPSEAAEEREKKRSAVQTPATPDTETPRPFGLPGSLHGLRTGTDGPHPLYEDCLGNNLWSVAFRRSHLWP